MCNKSQSEYIDALEQLRNILKSENLDELVDESKALLKSKTLRLILFIFFFNVEFLNYEFQFLTLFG